MAQKCKWAGKLWHNLRRSSSQAWKEGTSSHAKESLPLPLQRQHVDSHWQDSHLKEVAKRVKVMRETFLRSDKKEVNIGNIRNLQNIRNIRSIEDASALRMVTLIPRHVRLNPNHVAMQTRHYYADRRGVQHFKRRGALVWIQEPDGGGFRQQRILIILGVVGCVSAYTYYSNLQTVPYTHRRHFVLIGPSLEQSLGEQEFSNVKAQFSSKILPPIHPQTVRVRRIAKDVIEAAMVGAKAQDWGQIDHGHVPVFDEAHSRMDQSRGGKERFEIHQHQSHEDMYGSDKLEDDMWVEKSRQKGLDKGLEGYTAHLEKLKWEIIVVDEDVMNAFCLPGGKVVVFTGLLKQFRSDAEVSTVLGHEVGHVVARHVAEKLTQGIWLGFLQLLVLSVIYIPGLISSTSDLLLRLPFSRRMESEADHIGLLLMAAAGFDPRLAPGFYEKMGSLEKQPEFLQYASTHPSGKKRADALRQSSTMEEAVRIYEDKIAGQDRHGFL